MVVVKSIKLEIIQVHGGITKSTTKEFDADRPIIIGRSSECDIGFTYLFISNKQGIISFDSDKVYYNDNSKFGSIVEQNGKEIKVHKSNKELFKGSIIKVMDTDLNFGFKIVVLDINFL
mgnify:CR=1 FL=1